MLHRRGFLTGVFSAFAAPAIVRASSLMPVKALPPYMYPVNATILGESVFTAMLNDVTRKAFIPRLYVDVYPGGFRLLDSSP